MYSVSRYLCHHPMNHLAVDHGTMSGGLPHSEITGSKPIPGSPVLIAGYHVLHRLLLPRHPPNALLALDPIQRRTGVSIAAIAATDGERPFVARSPPPSYPRSAAWAPDREVIHFPAPRPGKAAEHSVSVLDLDTDTAAVAPPAQPGPTHTRANQRF